MKLPDFFELPLFNDLKKQMGVDKNTIGHIGSLKQPPPHTPIELPLAAIEPNPADGTLNYKGERVIAYIRDARVYEPRYHISNCQTLQKMRKQNRFDRYFAWSYSDSADQKHKDGYFIINIINKNTAKPELKKINVCKFCLEYLSFDGFSVSWSKDKKENYVKGFTPETFFKTYGVNSTIITKPTTPPDRPIDIYPPDWGKISQAYKIHIDWTCQSCRKNLSAKYLQRFLHVHHINGLKYENHPSNLKGLCIYCHAKEPAHGRLKATPDYAAFKKIFPD